ncbi:MAG: hypothetical protein ACREXP_23635 [Steroidobacteraceae bacterium]
MNPSRSNVRAARGMIEDREHQVIQTLKCSESSIILLTSSISKGDLAGTPASPE